MDFEIDLEADGGLELDCLPSTHRSRVEQPRQSSFEPLSALRPTGNGPASRPGNNGPASRPGNHGPASRPGASHDGGPPPSRPNGAAPVSRPNPHAPPPSSAGRGSTRMAAVSARGAGQPVVDPHAAIVAFAGFGDAPVGILSSPFYAWRVIRRKRTLRAELLRARQRGSHDIGVYEASLRAADDAAVRTGIIAAVMMVTLALLLTATVVQLFAGPLSLFR